MEIANRIVAVTGAASGIGRALAERFVAEGAQGVALVDIDEGVASVAASLAAQGAAVCAEVVDMTDAAGVEAMIARVEQRLGPIDLFCSNAGVSRTGGAELPTDDWQWVWDVNVMAHVHACRVLVPAWLERGGGHLLVTASAAGLLTQLGSAPYAVTKAGAVAFAEWITITYGDRGVTASALCPQGVRTPMTAGLQDSVVAVDGMIETDQVADAVVEGLAADRFLILPHPEVADYVRAKGDDRDRWIRGMRRLQVRFGEFPDTTV